MPRSLRRRPTVAALALTAVLVLAGCGDDGEPADEGSAAFNDADVTFAQQMIPHHEQAVAMAELADERAERDEVRELAADIEDAQAPEIELMTGWLDEWGAEVPSTDDMGHGADHGGMTDMPGMMSEQQLADLEAAEGAAWDRMFLTLMIAHHEGAVEMAQTEQADGANPDAVALAEKIEADQTQEIALMRDLLTP